METPDPQFANALVAFLNNPYILITTQAFKDISQRVLDKCPRVSAFIDRFILPLIPILCGTLYGYMVRPSGGSRLIYALHGSQVGAGMSGVYRTWQVMVKGK